MSRWSKLSARTQLRIALAVAQRRGEQLARAYPNVLSVGAGFRARSPSELPVREVCLRFLVSRKWKQRKDTAAAIPRRIRATVKIRGRAIAVSIPTDVSEFRGGAPHSILDATGGITSRRSGKAAEYGSACCLVYNVDNPAEQYVMSCYHVFSPQMNQPPGNLDCLVSKSGKVIGPMLEVANPYGIRAADAALALVNDASVQSLTCGGSDLQFCATATDIATLADHPNLIVYGRRAAPLHAQFHGFYPQATPFEYPAAGVVLKFPGVLEYIVGTQGGDSGAAVADADGSLYGMHFYGRGIYGYAISVLRLFESGVFPFDIELV